MEKFLVKRQKLSNQSEDTHCENTTSDSGGPSNSVKVPSQINSSSCAVRKYHDCYLSYGFTYSVSENHPCPECVVCGDKLYNESMVPSLFQSFVLFSGKQVKSMEKKNSNKCRKGANGELYGGQNNFQEHAATYNSRNFDFTCLYKNS
jgi:hypothetical protein